MLRPTWALAATVILGASCARTPVPGRKGPPAIPPTSAPQPQREPPSAPPQPAPPPTPAEPTAPAPPAPSGPREMFPLVRVDLAAKLVEFDGIVPINCHDPVTPLVYLELVACSPDTREHESLVMTRARPSNVHAALLAIGLEPGVPGSWEFQDKKLIPVPPRGDGVEVSVAYRDAAGREIECPVTDWIINARTGGPFVPREGDPAGPRWVFAGSVIAKRQGREVYDADGSGTFIGLCTFGSEVVAWRDTISPEAMVDEPVWIADAAKVPASGTPVVVRLRPAPRAP